MTRPDIKSDARRVESAICGVAIVQGDVGYGMLTATPGIAESPSVISRSLGQALLSDVPQRMRCSPAVASTAYVTGSAPASVRVSVESTTTWRWRINHLPSLLTNESR